MKVTLYNKQYMYSLANTVTSIIYVNLLSPFVYFFHFSCISNYSWFQTHVNTRTMSIASILYSITFIFSLGALWCGV